MHRLAGFFLLASPAFALAQVPATAPVAPVRPVTDSYFGTTVTDPYRWMETSTDELQAYMQAQNAVTAQTLQPFAAQDAQILDELTKLSDTVTQTGGVVRALDQYFYRDLPPGKSDARLMTRPVSGGSARLLLDPATLAEGGKHAAIDYFVPSPDGKYLAVGVSLGGSENSVLRVLDTTTGALLSEAISRAQDAEPAWTDDSKFFYFSRLQPMVPGAPASTKYDNRRVYLHRIGLPEDTDQAVFGPDVTKDPVLPKNGDVFVLPVPGTKMLLAGQVSGVVETPALWLRTTDRGAWTPVVKHEDGMMDFALHGTRLYIKTKSGANGAVSNGRVVAFDLAKETFADAHVLLPESSLVLSSRTGSGLAAASDALYVYGFRDGLGVVTRIPYEHEAEHVELKLPTSGTVLSADADYRRPGVTMAMMGWTTPKLIYAYAPETRSFADTGLQAPNPIDMSGVTTAEVQAKSADGTMVPLSILYRKGLAMDGSHPTLVEAYGAYGTSIPPFFDPSLLPWLNRGGVFALAHVRGGGERGEAWHLAGMKTTKQHTIDDFVACAQYLIDRRYTSQPHLAVSGTSAGGIAVGGFLTQHPEMLGAVLYRVGITDILRSEKRSSGGMNAFEYGSVSVEPEFRAMYAISPYAHVKDGAKYPAVLLETGANDPRVTSWMLTKMTARLQAANGSTNPILLRVDFDAGHGIGSGRKQALKLQADEYTFLGWRLGMGGFSGATTAGTH
ncbi:prolyl oligopeptidase family serine peptidase [Granulicella sibirica]|uniref:prolyl oligopeptidase n=1 Tax=Granulicella sibirica TaxID=2479048 RepID=A0A4V1L607_9BACT|nr:prolyl oligopeptidase family serine peptidase [Granulicella sibirica]RXH57604.1 Prolyl endopeptidase [Granulicella sibirica]